MLQQPQETFHGEMATVKEKESVSEQGRRALDVANRMSVKTAETAITGLVTYSAHNKYEREPNELAITKTEEECVFSLIILQLK